MLNIQTLILGDYEVNCYLVHDSGSEGCVLIDPGWDGPGILARLQALGLTLDAILLTHGHFDHVGAVRELAAAGCPVWLSPADQRPDPHPMAQVFYPLASERLKQMRFCGEADSIRAGGLDFSVMATPGHTPGSLCFLCGSTIFTGDTLFSGSCGRTDLPGGDSHTLTESLARLKNLPGDYTLYPGHGTATTLARERRYNPYLR